MINPNFDKLSSATNPNGVFEDFIDGSLKEQIPAQRERLAIAVADIKSFLVEAVGVDPDMAEVVAARSAREISSALDTGLTEAEVSHAIDLGSILSTDMAVERAVHNILG